jgi:hypothetical protein
VLVFAEPETLWAVFILLIVTHMGFLVFLVAFLLGLNGTPGVCSLMHQVAFDIGFYSGGLNLDDNSVAFRIIWLKCYIDGFLQL